MWYHVILCLRYVEMFYFCITLAGIGEQEAEPLGSLPSSDAQTSQQPFIRHVLCPGGSLQFFIYGHRSRDLEGCSTQLFSLGGATFRNHHLREGAEFAFAKDAGPLGKKTIVNKKDKQSTSAKGIKSLAQSQFPPFADAGVRPKGWSWGLCSTLFFLSARGKCSVKSVKHFGALVLKIFKGNALYIYIFWYNFT